MKYLLIILLIILAGCNTTQPSGPGSIVKVEEPCSYGWNGSLKGVDTGQLAQDLFRTQLECHKTNTGVDDHMKIIDYTFDGSSYSIKPPSIETSDWVAGDGIVEGEWITGKYLMFIHFYQSGSVYLMNHGTGP